MTAKQITVKKYVVNLGDDERERLSALIHMGKHPARRLMKARILLKAEPRRAAEGGATARSPRPWIRRSAEPVSDWWKKGLSPFSPASTRPLRPDGAFLMAPPRLN